MTKQTNDERLQKAMDYLGFTHADVRGFMDSVVYNTPPSELEGLESGLGFIGDALDRNRQELTLINTH